MNKKIVLRAVQLVFSALYIVTLLVGAIASVGENVEAYTFTVYNALKVLLTLLVFAWCVIDIYRFSKESM